MSCNRRSPQLHTPRSQVQEALDFPLKELVAQCHGILERIQVQLSR